jgi:hypothetical protein
VAEDTMPVVDHVVVAASDPLGFLNDPVESLSASIVDIFEKSAQDCRPLTLDRAGEPSGKLEYPEPSDLPHDPTARDELSRRSGELLDVSVR